MSSFEELQQIAADKGIDVVDWDFESNKIQGLYCDNVIAINKNISSSIAKACVLEEEIAHHDLTVGDIIIESIPQNCRQEQKARMLAFIRRVNLWDLANVLRKGYHSISDIAEYMDVTEEFLVAAIERYRQKYGSYVRVDDDTLLLDPTVALLSQIQ